MFTILRETWVRRDLIQELALKDLKLRYSRPLLGALWAFLLPFLTVLIFYVVFCKVLKVKTEEAPFILYLMSAVFPWKFFQDSLSGSVTSLMDNKNLLREARFPHYFIPLSVVLANAVNFLPSLMILIVTALIVLKGLPVFIFFLPLVLCVHFLITLGLSIIFSILYLKWRDVKYALEAFLMLLFYLTPAFYSISLIRVVATRGLFMAFIFNPFTGILNFYRISILKNFYGFIASDAGWLSFAAVPVLFAAGVTGIAFYFYKRNQNTINDHLSY